jgi:hypothetical protein
VNCDKLPRTIEAYQPRWSARDGARQVYDMVRQVGLAAHEFEGDRYARLPHMKKLIADGVVDERFRYRGGGAGDSGAGDSGAGDSGAGDSGATIAA